MARHSGDPRAAATPPGNSWKPASPARPVISDRPIHLLIVRLGAVGDVVRCLPSLEALRNWMPGARICWLVEPASASLLEGHPALDRLILFRRGAARTPWSAPVRETVGALRGEGFDRVADFHGILKSALFAWASGAPERFAFGPPLSREGSRHFATRIVEPPGDRWRPRQFLELAAAAAGEEPGEVPEARLPAREEERARMDEYLAGEGLGERPLVVLYPGASRGAGWKRWPPDRYSLLGRRLAAGGGADVVVAWGPGEEELASAVAGDGDGDDGIRLAPPTTLPELAELLRRADLFVGPDTGPAHIAGAVGTRVLGIYGPSDPVRNRPLGQGHVILAEGPPVRPRPWTRTLMAERMEAIPARRVYDEAARMLDAF